MDVNVEDVDEHENGKMEEVQLELVLGWVWLMGQKLK